MKMTMKKVFSPIPRAVDAGDPVLIHDLPVRLGDLRLYVLDYSNKGDGKNGSDNTSILVRKMAYQQVLRRD